MATDQSPIIVATGATAHTTSVHHRDFPEIRGDGENPADAANHLVNQLTRALDRALTKWRRESINKAITDAQEFAARRV